MPRGSKSEELASILSPLARDILKYLDEIGVALDIDQTIAFYTFVRDRALELSSPNAHAHGGGVANGRG